MNNHAHPGEGLSPKAMVNMARLMKEWQKGEEHAPGQKESPDLARAEQIIRAVKSGTRVRIRETGIFGHTINAPDTLQ